MHCLCGHSGYILRNVMIYTYILRNVIIHTYILYNVMIYSYIPISCITAEEVVERQIFVYRQRMLGVRMRSLSDVWARMRSVYVCAGACSVCLVFGRRVCYFSANLRVKTFCGLLYSTHFTILALFGLYECKLFMNNKHRHIIAYIPRYPRTTKTYISEKCA